MFSTTFEIRWIARLTRNVKDVGSSPIKGTRCFIEHDIYFTLIAYYWLVPGTDSSVISQSN